MIICHIRRRGVGRGQVAHQQTAVHVCLSSSRPCRMRDSGGVAEDWAERNRGLVLPISRGPYGW